MILKITNLHWQKRNKKYRRNSSGNGGLSKYMAYAVKVDVYFNFF